MATSRRSSHRPHSHPLLLAAATTYTDVQNAKEKNNGNGNMKPFQVIKTALWGLITAKLFRPSALRVSEALTFSPDAVVGSDFVLTGLALGTCPIAKVREYLLSSDVKTAAIGWVAVSIAGLFSSLLRRRTLKQVAKQAVKVEGEECVWRSTYAPEGQLVVSVDPDIQTPYDSFFKHAVVQYAKEPCFGTRTETGFDWEDYATVAAKASAFGSGLRELGMKKGDKLGIFSINTPQWAIAEFGGFCHGIVTVALYSTLGPEAVSFIVSHSEMTVAVCNPQNLTSLINASSKIPALKTIIYMDATSAPSDEQISAAKAAGKELLPFAEIIARGIANLREHEPPHATDVATIMYTSGTTGNPKGVVLTHRNVNAVASSFTIITEAQGVNARPGDRYLSYLPLAHIYERAMLYYQIHHGVSIGFFKGEVTALMSDIAALAPTLLVGVPRVFNRVYDKVMAKVAAGSAVKKFLFHTALRESEHVRKAGGLPWSIPFWDALVFKKVKAALGGKCRLIISGGAPLSAEVQSFLSSAFGCPCLQGYGLTETAAGGTSGLFRDPTSGHVGPPIPCLDLKLESVEEMNYTTADKPLPRGEICLRGTNIMHSYYKEEAMTKEAIDSDGWFHTGDIGQINENGTLTIIDRKKNIFKLSQGEYVAAEKLETLYQGAGLVAQIFVYGDSFQSVLVAVVVPEMDALRAWAKTSAGVAEDDASKLSDKELCELPGVAEAVLDELVSVGKAAKMNGFEIVKAVHIEHEMFTVENDLMTPTFKLKRPQLKAKYKTTIENLYAALNKS